MKNIWLKVIVLFQSSLDISNIPIIDSYDNFNPYGAVGYFFQYKIMQKSQKMVETLAYGYSSESTQWELSNEYQHGRV